MTDETQRITEHLATEVLHLQRETRYVMGNLVDCWCSTTDPDYLITLSEFRPCESIYWAFHCAEALPDLTEISFSRWPSYNPDLWIARLCFGSAATAHWASPYQAKKAAALAAVIALATGFTQ